MGKRDFIERNPYDLSKIAFRGEIKFLSNMYLTDIIFIDEGILTLNFSLRYLFNFDGKTYRSSEHLYQSLKSNDPMWKNLVMETESPEKVKTLARRHLGINYKIREDWESIRFSAMDTIVYLKFKQNEKIRKKLIEITGDIEEKNCWEDTFWGTVDGKGKNHLGKILMKWRDHFIQQREKHQRMK